MKYKLGYEKTCPGIAQNCSRCSKIFTTTIADPDHTASKEAVRSGSSLFAFLISVLLNPALIAIILFENRERKVFEI